ncbi:MAG: hypothetical protein P1U70_17675, partial [Saprospiraceae bacterium]|nr:hypothetical protein [Saprospiraceae bacterium]
AWDISGRFLACRYKNRETCKIILVVWDVKNKAEILRVETGKVNFSDIGFRWSPYSSKLACLVDQSRIQVFDKA